MIYWFSEYVELQPKPVPTAAIQRSIQRRRLFSRLFTLCLAVYFSITMILLFAALWFLAVDHPSGFLFVFAVVAPFCSILHFLLVTYSKIEAYVYVRYPIQFEVSR